MKYYYQVEGRVRNNIGDVLQGMVAKAFLNPDAEAVDREALCDMPAGEDALLVANGWYLHSFENFPPPETVTPVYTSVHVAQSQLLADLNVRRHFVKHAPIGCRDEKTLELFLGWGIPAYYSGCLTVTTARRSEINKSGEGEVLLVDNVDHPIPSAVKAKLEKLIGKTLTRISHDPPDTSGSFREYVKRSEVHMNALLERYCKAALVITTKIHCALPCLGMGANVMLIHPHPTDRRLAPVSEFMDILSYRDILEMESFRRPKVNYRALNKRKKFLTSLVRSSITKRGNALQLADTNGLRSIKYQSVMKARLYRMIVNTLLLVGAAGSQLRRVYGSAQR